MNAALLVGVLSVTRTSARSCPTHEHAINVYSADASPAHTWRAAEVYTVEFGSPDRLQTIQSMTVGARCLVEGGPNSNDEVGRSTFNPAGEFLAFLPLLVRVGPSEVRSRPELLGAATR